MPIEPLPSNPTQLATKPAETSVAPVMGALSGQDDKNGKAGKDFGPDYVLEDALKSNEVVGGVPFAPVAAAQTLAALPPIYPLGTASLTELSLQKMMQPRHNAK